MLRLGGVSFSTRRRAGLSSLAQAHVSISRLSSCFSTATSQSQSPNTPPLASEPPKLSKVLIANRGEIACRVIRTCQTWGIPTVALYSSADGPNALHARMADEAYLIGTGPTPAESYLRQDDILDIAAHVSAAAIHPGYGFLSENSKFAQRVQSNGLVFIGPPASAMLAMGSKSQSKAIMEAAGVPTTPGYYGDDTQDADFLLDQAKNKIGFPVLIKAVMGGGGKGMRLVWNETEFKAALEACQRESLAAFGDSNVLLEKYLVKPRHVEVQVVADSHGNVVSLHERDCSLQRRHQKIIEEAPASDLPQSLRERLGEMGRRAAQAVGYVNAGTVEFLLDTQQPKNGQEQQFYFCEMNTRLQVEHPITELITGVDLVEWQLRIAAGEKLPILDQAQIPCQGHAFEARIYAENPARNFLPATGTLWHHNPPAAINTGLSQDGIRVDTGLQANQAITVYYDPMISKLIVYDKQGRSAALRKLIQALKSYQIAGVPTNIDFLIKCAQHPTFGQAGAVNTGFLEDYADDVRIVEATEPSPLAQSVGAYVALLYLENRLKSNIRNEEEIPASFGPWSSRSGSWRMGGELGRARRTLVLENGETLTCVSNRDGSFDIYIDEQQSNDEVAARKGYHVSGSTQNEGNLEVLVNGTQRIHIKTVLKLDGDLIRVRMWPKNLGEDYSWEVNVQHPLIPLHVDAALAKGGGAGIVKAPMPGTIRRVFGQVGDTVKAGQAVMVMEAMKMEHSISALRDGVLTEIRYQVGDVVPDGAILLVVGDEADEASEESTA